MAKRIEFNQYGDASVLAYADFTPRQPADNEVLIANKAIGINYIDTYVRSGLYPAAQLPSSLGTEAAGLVEAVGAKVKHLKVGDRVAYCQSPLGAYSQYHVVSAERVIVLPDNVSFEQAAAVMLKGLTAYYLLNLTYQVKRDEIILFHAAAGGVGQIACQWAKAIGAKLIGTVGSDEKIAIAKQAGAWEVINHNKTDIVQKVLELTNHQKVNVVYDSIGKDMWLTSLDCLKRRGLMVSFGNASGPVTGVDLGILNKKGSLFVTRPSLAGYVTTLEELQEAGNKLFSMVASGAIKVEVNPNQIFALKDAQQAHKTIESRKTTGSSLLIP
ncbi:NADPH:quinone reductase [Utexia brackfieldae]|uniref:NADPH:quinone reductase n=1 Tax=Utexia brackfieldae TaxID=3074108 RepID=UPI00370D2833